MIIDRIQMLYSERVRSQRTLYIPGGRQVSAQPPGRGRGTFLALHVLLRPQVLPEGVLSLLSDEAVDRLLHVVLEVVLQTHLLEVVLFTRRA